MMKTFAFAAAAALLPLSLLTAQDVQVVGGNGEPRLAASKLAFNQDFSKCFAQVCIQYGSPPWKDDYAKMLEAKNQNIRLGRNYWTTLNTANDLTIGGVKMPAGAYYLGLHADANAKMHLAAFPAAASDEAGQGPWAYEQWKIDWVAPLEHAEADTHADNLAIHLLGDSLDKITLQIHWGGHALTAPVVIHPMGKSASEASGDKDRGQTDGDADKGKRKGADAVPVRRK